MIFDRLEAALDYRGAHPGFEACFDYLKDTNWRELPEGTHEIDGDHLFAVVSKKNGKGQDQAVLETHDQYIDVQLTAAGMDRIGWESRLNSLDFPSDNVVDGDVLFYTNQPTIWLPMSTEMFSIFFPQDAHAPMGGEGMIHKVVIKIAVDW